MAISRLAWDSVAGESRHPPSAKDGGRHVVHSVVLSVRDENGRCQVSKNVSAPPTQD